MAARGGLGSSNGDVEMSVHRQWTGLPAPGNASVATPHLAMTTASGAAAPTAQAAAVTSGGKATRKGITLPHVLSGHRPSALLVLPYNSMKVAMAPATTLERTTGETTTPADPM